MEKTFAQTDAGIEAYAVKTFQPEDSVLAEIRKRAAQKGLPDIHVGPMDSLHLEVLARAVGARKIVEIGTLAGLSGVALARALPADGKLFTFEYEARHAEVARESFEKAQISSKVEIFVGPASSNLGKIDSQGPFDLVFIDADKVNYPAYLEWAAANLRIGGVLLADNTFAWGKIGETAESGPEGAPVRALQQFNLAVATSGRFRATILPTGEGLTFAVKVR